MDYPSKMLLLYLIRDKKEILFGRFTDILTHDVKVNEWKNILNELLSQGILVGRDWKFLRNTVWQNLKRSTMFKIDNARKNSEGSTCKLRRLDNIVLDILGMQPPADKTITLGDPIALIDNDPLPPTLPNLTSDKRNTEPQAKVLKSFPKRRKNDIGEINSNLMALKKAKLKLEIYNLQLDARRKEQDLGLPPNYLTESVE